MKNLYNNILEDKELLIENKSKIISNALREGKQLDEGFFGAVLGGIAGLTAGASVMKAVCKALGVEKGPLYDVLTSKIVCGSVGTILGKNL